MKRNELIKYFSKKVHKKQPIPPKIGDCWEMSSNSISEQLKRISSHGKVFYLMCKDTDYNGKIISISLISESVYISPINYNEI